MILRHFPKMKKELETLIQTIGIYNQYIRMEFKNLKMSHADNEKERKRNNGRN